MMTVPLVKVALLAEGVDRNFHAIALVIVSTASPSSQRAWIEINRLAYSKRAVTSPSSQRAWIEILPPTSLWAFKDCRPPRRGRG